METEPGQPRQRNEPHRGTLILVLGILSITLGWLGLTLSRYGGVMGIGAILGIIASVSLGITAWLMANRDLKKIDAMVMDPAGRAITQAGKICGIIGIAIFAVGLLITCSIAALLWFALRGSHPG